jgi:hypothetical protein
MLPGSWSAAGIHPLCNTCWHLVCWMHFWWAGCPFWSTSKSHLKLSIAAIHQWLDKSILPYFLISFLVVLINSWVSPQSTPFSWRLRTPAASSYFQVMFLGLFYEQNKDYWNKKFSMTTLSSSKKHHMIFATSWITLVWWQVHVSIHSNTWMYLHLFCKGQTNIQIWFVITDC